MTTFNLYTDGAATMRKVGDEYVREAGGFAYAILDDSNELIMSAYGGTPSTTNNAMELEAIYNGLYKIYNMAANVVGFANIRIYTDSAYCINIFTQWIRGWKANGWTRGKKHEPIENVELIKAIYELIEGLDKLFVGVEWVKVKGHSGDKWNEYVDSCAVEGKTRAAKLDGNLYIEGYYFVKGVDIPKK